MNWPRFQEDEVAVGEEAALRTCKWWKRGGSHEESGGGRNGDKDHVQTWDLRRSEGG